MTEIPNWMVTLGAIGGPLGVFFGIWRNFAGERRKEEAAESQETEDRFRAIEKDQDAMREMQRAFQTEVISEFVRRDVFDAAMERLYTKLDRLDDKMDGLRRDMPKAA